MNKLPVPRLSFHDTYTTCIGGIANDIDRERMSAVSPQLEQLATEYVELAERGSLYSIQPLRARRREDPEVFENVRKSDLVKIYSDYMVDREPGRGLYDQIKVSSNGSCPFCSGIGEVKTVDHYLPKANYPQFSVHPANLVPACRDCNTGKSNRVAEEPEDQVLHPYYEPDQFYTDAWIQATVEVSESIAIKYYAAPPEEWDDVEKARAICHFLDFGLATRYGRRAAEELSTVVYTRSTILSQVTSEEFRTYLMSVASSFDNPNNWKPAMYKALAEDEGFCEMDSF